ncbi:MAG: hypothetical protein WDM87_07315 [Terracidiphilus sp.]
MIQTLAQFVPDSAHGLLNLAAAAVFPWYSVETAVIPNAIVLLLAFILLGFAIEVLLRSIKAKRKTGQKQGQATESQMLQTLEHAIEEGRASLDLDVAASPNTHEQIPSPLAELALQIDKTLPELNPEPKPLPHLDPHLDPDLEHGLTVQSALNGTNGSNGTNGNGFAHPPASPSREETARVSLPRLSELRGMRFSQALRELDRAKRTAPANAGLNSLNGSLNSSHHGAFADRQNDSFDDSLDDPLNDPISEALLSAIAPFETMFATAGSTLGDQNGATAMHENGAAATKNNGAQGSTSHQPFFSAKPAQPDRRRSRREEKDRRSSPREPKAPVQETNGFIDQLEILPSRRGQYKKKA